MKYKVVGWTYFEDEDYPEEECSEACALAIIDDIREHGYEFTGYGHQNYLDGTPVLSDGKRRCFTERGWGRIMARAHGMMGVYDYSRYAFSMCMSYKDEKTPLYREFSESDILKPEEMNEVYTVSVSENEFQRAAREKCLDVYENDYLRYIDIGDTVILECDGKSREYKVSGAVRGRDENGGVGEIDPITEYHLESRLYANEDKERSLALYESGVRVIILFFEH